MPSYVLPVTMLFKRVSATDEAWIPELNVPLPLSMVQFVRVKLPELIMTAELKRLAGAPPLAVKISPETLTVWVTLRAEAELPVELRFGSLTVMLLPE